ncbi:peptidoglycan bridge formation glycyltransferase FemA/FemB family protein [Gemella bergeri]|nr:peptidoglycan bridge formation glycyltransferase FemA/FemB family protein [Gemella bergeri]
MIFTEISNDELRNFQQENNKRYLFSQSFDFANVLKTKKQNYKILAVKDNNKILAYGVFIYFRYKKYFYKVTAQHGPIMDYSNTKLVKFYFEQLKKYYTKNLRVLCVRVNPFLNEKIYNDVKFIEYNEEAVSTDNILTSFDYKALNDDLFTNPTLAPRCLYSTELKPDLTTDNLIKNISTMAKRSINKALKENIIVKEIDIFDNYYSKIFDNINKNTEKRINFEVRDSTYFKILKKILKDKLHLMVSYLDCDLLISNLEKENLSIINDKSNLVEKLNSKKINRDKTLNKIAKLEESIIFNNNKISKITDLKNIYGNIIYLSCASFIESNQDFIYFSGGMIKELSKFNGTYAIMYEMLKYAIERNFKYFNFYGTSKDFDSEDAADYSVLQFKRNFNGNIEYFMDNYEIRNAIGKIWKI